MPEENAQAWVCLVCGYVHRGPEPPDTCPVCGASSDDFEPQEDEKPEPKAAATKWRCLVCGYVHEGPEPPDTCPVCGASADDFEPVEDSSGVAEGVGSAAKVLVLGAGVAGVSAAEALREASSDAEIVLVSKEDALPYYRLNLSRYLAGEIEADALPIHPEAWYEEHKVRLLRGVEAKSVRPADHTVSFSDGSTESYEKLVLATGAHPFIPPISGVNKDGVSAFRSRAHAEALIEAGQSGAKVVVIGGGILGLETAGALVRRGADVTLLEGHERLMPRQLNSDAGALLERHVEGVGIHLRKNAKTTEIVGTERAEAVLLEDGDRIEADLVVVTTGVRPNTCLARAAKLEVNKGVVVDSRLVTSDADILAVGDVAEHQGVLYGLWEPARYQGVIAGMNLAGQDAEFGGLPRANTLKVLGVSLFSIGMIEPPDGSYRVYSDTSDGHYKWFMFHDNRLVGAILLGDARLTAACTKAVKEGTDCSVALGKDTDATAIASYLARQQG